MAGMQTVQTIPAGVTEDAGILNKAGSVVLDATGSGVITFDPDNARQRWEVTRIPVSTSQAAGTTPIPRVSVSVNEPSSPGNGQGATWSGNLDTFTGLTDVGPCDFLAVTFTGGQPGTTAYANVSGTRYTRRS